MADNETIRILIAEADTRLQQYRREHAGLSWRAKVLVLVQLENAVKGLGINSDPVAARVSARERIRLYLVAHVGLVIDAAEVEVVSGISDYGRRVRELRVQDGYGIITGHSNDPETGVNLKPDQYLLINQDPDITAARRWQIANRIRREADGGCPGRLLRFLLANVGQVVTTEELRYVGKAGQYARRTRELRTQQGYAIATIFTGRPDLRMGEYVLETEQRIAEPHDRHISGSSD